LHFDFCGCGGGEWSEHEPPVKVITGN